MCADTFGQTSGEEQAECGIASGFPQGSVISIDSDAISRHDFSHNGPRMKRAYSSSELQVASLLNSDTDSLSQETCSLGDVEMKAVGISPERLRNLHPASLTVAQAKAITGNSHEACLFACPPNPCSSTPSFDHLHMYSVD